MDHREIEEHNIPDRYLQGKLAADERTRFEEHFMECAECLERLEMTEDFRTQLRIVASEEAVRSPVYARPGLRAWLVALTGPRQAALLAAAVVLLVALPAALLLMQAGQSRREAEQARLSSADWQRRYEESQQTAANLRTREQELQKQLEERQTQSGAGLPGAAPIYDLNIVRSGGLGQPARATQISVPRAAAWIVLKLEIEPDAELQSYRATISTSGQQLICRASDLIPVKDALAISCDSNLFKPGSYRLALDGLTKQGRYVSAATYSFQVIQQ
jgi:hypothetical protein